MVIYETRLNEIKEADKVEPISIIVEIVKVTIDERTGKEVRELERTIQYFPKRYKKKPKVTE